MGFEPIRDNRGQPRVKCICEDCGREEVVAADHSKGSGIVGQAVPKLQKLGWVYLSKTLRCGTCVANRKVVRMAEKKTEKTVADTPREPTRAQKREIMDLLDDVYDTDAERYRRGDTDATVADVLSVLPGWVAQLREEFFGPAGESQEMADLAKALTDAVGRIDDASREVDAARKKVSDLAHEVDRMSAALEAIRAAVGPRVLSKAKVTR